MIYRDASAVESWHAHVYFDAATKDAALLLREAIATHLADLVSIGRFHEKPVGPHPEWSYQIAFTPERLGAVLTWLTLNHGALDVFLHPNTGDSLRDHRDASVWIGHSHSLVLKSLMG